MYSVLCELLKMEQIATALARLGTQAVSAMTCVYGQLIFSTDEREMNEMNDL